MYDYSLEKVKETTTYERVTVRRREGGNGGNELQGAQVEETRSLPPKEPERADEEKAFDFEALGEYLERLFDSLPDAAKRVGLGVLCVLALGLVYLYPRGALRVAANATAVALLASSPYLTGQLTSLWDGYNYPDEVEEVLDSITASLDGLEDGLQGVVFAAIFVVSALSVIVFSSLTVWIGCLSIYAIVCAVPAAVSFVEWVDDVTPDFLKEGPLPSSLGTIGHTAVSTPSAWLAYATIGLYFVTGSFVWPSLIAEVALKKQILPQKKSVKSGSDTPLHPLLIRMVTMAVCGLFCADGVSDTPLNISRETLRSLIPSLWCARWRAATAEILFTSYLLPQLILAVQFVYHTVHNALHDGDSNTESKSGDNSGVVLVASTITVLLRSISRKADPLTSLPAPYLGRLRLAVLSVLLNRLEVPGDSVLVLGAMHPLVHGIVGGLRVLWLALWLCLVVVGRVVRGEVKKYQREKKEEHIE
ncbi:hypothetical protein KIPB_010630 [Kipferlia bialata]|uniref:Transmembrane protein n=1 Tax=Kipferlia bialata TaxID=797122 RepID=A0A9K3D3I6_9EUKA|nr:hypothetical protein KIPB_010630 [Kipferlia bialata]|eukprot:g10630.t1